jgi:hypothetical protein
MTSQRYDRNLTELSRGETDFGIKDKQGRAVGYAWRIFHVTYTPVPEGQLSGYIAPAGLPLKHLEVAAYPTRNGRHYGASSGNIHVFDQDQAMRIVEKRTAQARKRDTKKFGAAPVAEEIDWLSDAANGWRAKEVK